MGPGLTLYLADACALIDFARAATGFPPRLRMLIEQRAGDIAIVATTVWEIAIKIRIGKLADIRDAGFAQLGDMFRYQGYELLPFDHLTAEQAANLPGPHKDPFDRALVATAHRTGRTVITSDRAIERYGVPIFW